MNFCSHSERHLHVLLKDLQEEHTFMYPCLPGTEVNDGDRLRARQWGVVGSVEHDVPQLLFNA